MAWVLVLIVTGFLLIAPKIAYADILLNEIMANVPTGENEWIELYNTSSSEVDISGWSIEERTGSDLTGIKSHSITSLSIPGNSFKIFEFTTASLNNSGDIITLKDNNSNVKDSYQYSSSTQNKTYGRQPDGGNWNSNLDQTKNSSNGGTSSTPTPTSSPTSTPSSTPTPISTFTISDTPSQINSDQSFNSKINLSLPSSPSTKLYLKGAFKKSDSSNYFGLTKVNGNWIKNGNGYSDQFTITTDSSGNWSGSLEVKPDNSDSGFTGNGDYIFKVGKYNSTDPNPSVSWSNEITIKINGDPPSSQPTPKTNPSNFSSPAASKSSTPKPTQQLKSSSRIASVAAATAFASFSPIPSPEVVVKNQKQVNLIVWVGIIFIFAGISLIGYIYFKKHAKNRL